MPLAALALTSCLSACNVGGPAEGPALRPPSDPMIEHRAGMVDEPVFGGRMYVFEAGPLVAPKQGVADTIVLVHGLSTQGAGDWRHVVPALARHHRVLSFDLPGFARSDQSDHHYSLAHYSRLLHWLLETRAGGGPVILVGHSLGATLSLFHAAEHPEDVEKLVLVDAAGILHRTAYVKYVARIRDAGLLSASADLEEGLNEFIGRLVEFSEELPALKMQTILDDDEKRRTVFRGSSAAVAGSSMIEVDFSQRLGRVEMPTLVIWGTKDDVAPLRTGRILAARLPDVRLQRIQGAGHTPMLDHPADFLRLLLEALDRWPAEDPIRLPAPSDSAREGVCQDTDDMSFEGDYASLRIDGCDRVWVRNGSFGRIEIQRSSADLDNVRIDAAEGVALRVDDSAVALTNVRVEGDTALVVEDARVDLANVELVGRQDAVRTVDDSTIVFSVCLIESPHGSGTMHGSYEFTKDSKL